MGDCKEYVYVLTHLATNKKYVGRTTDPERRCMEHLNALVHGKHYNKNMQADYNKYGGDYQFEVVCVETKKHTDEFLQDEIVLMRKLRTYDERYGYNDKDPEVAFIRCIYGLPPHKRTRKED